MVQSAKAKALTEPKQPFDPMRFRAVPIGNYLVICIILRANFDKFYILDSMNCDVDAYEFTKV